METVGKLIAAALICCALNLLLRKQAPELTLALCAVLTVNAVQLQRTSTVTALDVSQGQSIVFSSGRVLF